jgi:hypothetical protein
MPVAAYAVFVYWRRWKLLFRAAFWVVVGVLPFIVITLLYNRRVTGSFTEFPLTAKNPLDTLGFGARSLMPGDSTLDYTIGRAFRSAAKNIRVLPPFLFGGFLAMAVAAVGLWVRRRDRTTLLLLAIMAVFPLAYFFFWGTLLSSPFAALTGPLYYIPLFAPLCVLVAAAILALWRSRRGWAVALCFALVVATVPVMIAKIDRNHTISVAQLPWKNATATIREDSLVFVEGGGMYPIHLNPYAQNAPNLDGRILFAADREAENIDLISANPTRAPYLERTSDPAWDNPGHKAPPPEISLVPLTVVDGRTVTLRVRVTNPDRDAVVVVVHQPSICGVSAEYGEVIAGYELDETAARLAGIPDRRRLDLPREDAREDVIATTQLAIERSAEGGPVVRQRELLQLSRAFDRQCAQEQPVDQRENRGVRADGDSNRQNHGGRKNLLRSQNARAVTDVLPQSLRPTAAAYVVGDVVKPRGGAESLLRVALGIGGAHAATFVLARPHLHVKAELVRDVIVNPIGLPQRAQPISKDSQFPHGVLSAQAVVACITFAIASIKCSQRNSSMPSCFLPARVSR